MGAACISHPDAVLEVEITVESFRHTGLGTHLCKKLSPRFFAYVLHRHVCVCVCVRMVLLAHDEDYQLEI